MIICPDYGSVFISTPKTGTHSMYKFLKENCGGEQYVGGYHRTKLPFNFRDYHVFTTIRHPLERFVSAWNSLLFTPEYRAKFISLVGSDRFEDFVDYVTSLDNQVIHPGSGFPVLSQQTVWHRQFFKLNSLLDIDNIKDELYNLFEVDTDDFPHELKRDHARYEDLVKGRCKHKLISWFSDDIEKFGDIYEY